MMVTISKLFVEARRRSVFRTGGFYIVGAWVFIQVSQLAMQSLGYPDSVLRFFWLAAILAFPLVLVFAWRYDITPDGIKRTPPADVAENYDPGLRRPDFVLLTALSVIGLVVSAGVVNEIRQIDPTASPAVSTGVNPNSLAVLPFTNASGDPANEYLSAGIHDGLIASLSQISSLQVIARNSTLNLDRALNARRIGSVLNVANIVEGSVTRVENRMRLTLNLINAATNESLWSQSYDREISDVQSVEEETTRAITTVIKGRLSAQDEEFLTKKTETRPETYEAYLRGIFQLHKETPEGDKRGIAIMTEAIEKDPSSALANAALAYGYGKLGHSPFPVDGAYERSKNLALKALSIDDSLPVAHLAVGMYKLYYEWDWIGAEYALKRAIELNPNLAEAHYHYAWMMELLGNREEALEAGEITRKLDPLDPFMVGWLADQYRSAGNFDKAIEMAREAIDLNPEHPVAWLVLGYTYSEMGRHDEAIEAHQILQESPFWKHAIGIIYANAGMTDKAQAVLDSMGSVKGFLTWRVLTLAAMRRDDEFFDALAAAKEARPPWFPWFVCWFEQTRYLADDARMQAYAEELNLELRPAPERLSGDPVPAPGVH